MGARTAADRRPGEAGRICRGYTQTIRVEGTSVATSSRQAIAALGLPPLPTLLFRSGAILADLILQPCTPGFEFPLLESEEKLHFIGCLLPKGASGDVPAAIKEAKETGRKIVLVSQGTIANNDLSKLLAPTIQGLGDRDDLLILVTTGGSRSRVFPVSCQPTLSLQSS